MRWSKLRSLIEGRFCPALAGRLAIHSAAYGNCSCGHCWITLDKEVIANFCTRAYYNKKSGYFEPGSENSMYGHQLVMYGEMSRQGAYKSMFDYIHTLSLQQALDSQDVLVQALSIVDKRLGRRRLEALNIDSLHPLANSLLSIRKAAELGLMAGAA